MGNRRSSCETNEFMDKIRAVFRQGEILALFGGKGIEVVRVSFVDQHGVVERKNNCFDALGSLLLKAVLL